MAVDCTDRDQVRRGWKAFRPTHVIHAAALTSVAECARFPDQAEAVNVASTRFLAELAAEDEARFLLVSTDLVFDGEAAPYQEGDPLKPLSIYGRSKQRAELACARCRNHVVVRCSLLYGRTPSGRQDFSAESLQAMRQGREVMLLEDEWRTPLSYEAAAAAIMGIVASDFTGVIHVGGPERVSRLEMALRLARRQGVATRTIRIARRAELPGEPRPRDTSLDSRLWRRLFPEYPWPTIEEADL